MQSIWKVINEIVYVLLFSPKSLNSSVYFTHMAPLDRGYHIQSSAAMSGRWLSHCTAQAEKHFQMLGGKSVCREGGGRPCTPWSHHTEWGLLRPGAQGQCWERVLARGVAEVPCNVFQCFLNMWPAIRSISYESARVHGDTCKHL